VRAPHHPLLARLVKRNAVLVGPGPHGPVAVEGKARAGFLMGPQGEWTVRVVEGLKGLDGFALTHNQRLAPVGQGGPECGEALPNKSPVRRRKVGGRHEGRFHDVEGEHGAALGGFHEGAVIPNPEITLEPDDVEVGNTGHGTTASRQIKGSTGVPSASAALRGNIAVSSRLVGGGEPVT